MKSFSGTTDGFLPILPWVRDDEYVSDEAKHSRHARQTTGAHV